MISVRDYLAQLRHFFSTDIWSIPLDTAPRHRSIAVRYTRIILLSARGFVEDKCQLRASALTFYSLLSIVPVAALAFAIAKGFGFEKMLENQIMARVPGQTVAVEKVIAFSHALLQSTKGGLLAGLGIVLLLWTILKVLSHIEASFNDIWGVQESRSLSRKISDYLAILFISPILIIVSSSITVFVMTQVTTIVERISLLGFISPLIFFALKLLPYILIWILLTFVYTIIPNTTVHFRPALIAGIIAGTTYEITQWLYIHFQVGTAKYNAIYGSFAALPLFLIWLQVSWLIILFGAEISFAHQNIDTYEMESESLHISTATKRCLLVYVSHLVVDTFARGEKPLTAPQIAHRLEQPIRLTRAIIHDLTESGIFSQIKTESDKEYAYQPARDIGTLTIRSVISAVEENGDDTVSLVPSETLENISGTLASFEEALTASPENRLVRDL